MPRPRTLHAILWPLAAVAPACSSTPPPAPSIEQQSTFSQDTGSLRATLPNNLEDAYNAAKGAVEDMHYTMEWAHADRAEAAILAREPDGRRVEVILTPAAPTAESDNPATGVEINVGPDGNQAKARLILDKILLRLK